MTENSPGPMAGKTALVAAGTGGIARESGNPGVDAFAAGRASAR